MDGELKVKLIKKYVKRTVRTKGRDRVRTKVGAKKPKVKVVKEPEVILIKPKVIKAPVNK